MAALSLYAMFVLAEVRSGSEAIAKSYMPEIRDIVGIDRMTLTAVKKMNEYIGTRDTTHWDEARGRLGIAYAGLKVASASAVSVNVSEELAQGFAAAESSLSAYMRSCNDTHLIMEQMAGAMGRMDKAADAFTGLMSIYTSEQGYRATANNERRTSDFSTTLDLNNRGYGVMMLGDVLRFQFIRALNLDQPNMAEKAMENFSLVVTMTENLAGDTLDKELGALAGKAAVEAKNLLENGTSYVSLWKERHNIDSERLAQQDALIDATYLISSMGIEKTTALSDNASNSLSQLSLRLKISLLIALLTATTFAFLLTRSISRPLQQGVHFAASLAEGRLDETLRITGRDEVGALAAALNSMGATLRQRIEDLSKAKEEALSANSAKSDFLANMSHEIRTPMNAILGLTHLALETELNEQQHEYLHRIEVAAKALLRIINDILDFSKIEAGKLEMEEAEFHLGDFLRGVMEIHAGPAHDKGLEFALDLPAATPFGLRGDQVRLSQIVNNLIGNAVKFTDQGAIIVRVTTLEDTPEAVLLRFTVEDSGIGLSPEQASKLFNPFTQADTTTTRKYGGTGLGLVISKRLAEMMGGEIWCQSELGRGSTFGFTARFKPSVLEEPGPALSADSFKGFRALVVDDNDQALEILSQAMSSMGLVVVEAASGEEALKCYAEAVGQGAKFDLIVVDWQMPDMDGGETVRRLAEAWGPLPAVMMVTGFGREDVADSARAANIQKILTKPISLSSLNNALMETFGRRQVKPGKKKGGAAEEDLRLIEAIRGARILLTEDNEVNQLVASRILAKAGFEVTIAGNGLEALNLAQKEQFDLVLMDIQMPVMDGLTATKNLRALPRFKDLPIVAMTAHAMSGDRETSLKAGMNDHITKPINISELYRALARWIPPRAA